jgi:hypothetical protein
MGLEGFGHLKKKTITSSGIEPATLSFILPLFFLSVLGIML